MWAVARIYKESNTMDIVKGVIDKVASRKLAMTVRSPLTTAAAFMKPFSIRQDGTVTSY